MTWEKKGGFLMNTIIAPFRKYAQFGGRSTRTEFWCFALLFVLATMAANYVDASGGERRPIAGRFGTFELIASLLLLLPILSVGTRRLHDIGRSGWNLLLLAVPYAGWLFAADNRSAELLSLGGVALGFLALMVLMLLPGDPEANAYGASPRG